MNEGALTPAHRKRVKEIDKDSSLDKDTWAVICRAVGFFVFGG